MLPTPTTAPQSYGGGFFEDLGRRLEQRRQNDERSFREEMAATQQSFQQVYSQKEAELKQAQQTAQAAMLAASASTNEIKDLRASQAFYQQLASELGLSKQEAQAKLANLTETQRNTLNALVQANRKV